MVGIFGFERYLIVDLACCIDGAVTVFIAMKKEKIELNSYTGKEARRVLVPKFMLFGSTFNMSQNNGGPNTVESPK